MLTAAYLLFVEKNEHKALRILDECAVSSCSTLSVNSISGFYPEALRAMIAVAENRTVKNDLIQSITLQSESSVSCLMVLVE